MAADAMQRHAGRHLAVAGVKGHPLAEDVADHQRDMLHREGMTQHAVAHAAPGGVAHLAVLQMKSRIGKQLEIAGVVIVQMGDHDIPDGFGADAEARQRLDRIKRELAVARLRLCRVEAGVDQNIAAVASDQPDEVVEVLRGGLMRIGQQVIHVGRSPRHRRIANSVDFVGVFHRSLFPDARLADVGTKTPSSAKVKRASRSALSRALLLCERRHRLAARQGNPFPRVSVYRGELSRLPAALQTVDRACRPGLIMRFS